MSLFEESDYWWKPEITTTEEFRISAHMHRPEAIEDHKVLPDGTGSSSLQERIRSINLAQGSPSETPPTSRHGKPREIDLKAIRHAIDLLNKSQSIQTRKTGAEYVGSNITSFSVDALGAVWAAADDLFQEDAPLGLRNLGFTVIESSLLHTGLGRAERMKLFRMIVVPIEPLGMDKQVQALTTITDYGKALEPFILSLVAYLSTQLDPIHKASVEARKKLKSDRADGSIKAVATATRKALQGLLSLIEGVFRAHPDAIEGDELNIIIHNILKILQITSSERDMKGALLVIQAVIAVSHIPLENMKLCVEVLGAISIGIEDLRDMALGCLQDLLVSGYQSCVLPLLIDIALSETQGPESMNVKGAVAMVVYLVQVDEEGDLPKIPTSELYDRLFHETKSPGTAEYWRNWLRLFGQLLVIPNFIDHVLARNEWVTILKRTIDSIKIENGESQLEKTIFVSYPSTPTSFPVPYQSGKPDLSNLLTATKEGLSHIIVTLGVVWSRMMDEAQWRVFLLTYFFRDILPVQSQRLLVSYVIELGMLLPNDGKWDDCLSQIGKEFILAPQADIEIRRWIVTALRNTLSNLTSADHISRFRSVVIPMLDNMKWHEEEDLHFINSIAELVASYALFVEAKDFNHLLQLLWLTSSVGSKILQAFPRSYEHEDETARSTVSVALVRLFLQSLPESAYRTSSVYATLIEVAKARNLATCIRLPALRLLTRLRCNIYHAIYVTPYADSLGLAVAIARTETSKVRLSVYQTQGDRSSLYEELGGNRIGRSSTPNYSGVAASRASTQSAGRQDAEIRAQPPQWLYPGLPGLPQIPLETPSLVVNQYTPGAPKDTTLRLSDWLAEVIDMLQTPNDWEIYSYVLVHLPSQLSNPTLFSTAVPHIQLLRNVIVSQLMNGTFRMPPGNTGVKKGDVAFCLYNTLVMLLGYNEHFSRGEQDDIVRIILEGISLWDRVGKVCIQGLGICCHVIPMSVTRLLGPILQKMSQMITQTHLAMDILEFLAGLARLPDVYINLREDELRTVFAICVRYLEHSRDQRTKLRAGASTESIQAFNRSSGISGDSGAPSEASNHFEVQRDLPQYIFALAYHVLTIWFLSIRLADRPRHVGWITSNLASKDDQGNDVLEEQSQVTLDMMHRTAYLDLGETVPSVVFSEPDGRVFKKSWLLGLSIVTVETASGSGLTQLIKRQASGTTYAAYLQSTAELPPHHVRGPTDLSSPLHGREPRVNIFPNHVFLQLTSTIAPTPSPMEAICLPDDETTRRALAAFDRNDTVDGYKVGVIYAGYCQTGEGQILANTSHAESFQQLLDGLGTKVRLKGAVFNTQGLDKDHDTDGKYTYAWRDRITEIVFHIPSLMPTDETGDPTCVKKKSHIGNDFVNIIFNDSGSPFKFDTFPSQFNYVNIIITPESPRERKNKEVVPPSVENNPYPQKQLYCTIQTQSHPSFPNLSPAASYKLVPLKNAAGLARQIALSASVFSNVWSNREGGEHVSSWRNRLREIKKLRARFANSGTSASDRYPGAKGSKSYVEGDSFTGSVVMGGLAEDDGILSGLDFSRWAGPNPPLN